jgi:hypothetical protein
MANPVHVRIVVRRNQLLGNVEIDIDSASMISEVRPFDAITQSEYVFVGPQSAAQSTAVKVMCDLLRQRTRDHRPPALSPPAGQDLVGQTKLLFITKSRKTEKFPSWRLAFPNSCGMFVEQFADLRRSDRELNKPASIRRVRRSHS